MSRMKTHVIHWVSTVNGSVGTGKRLFEKEEAERLAAELNSNYPEIDHEAVQPGPPSVVLANEPSLPDASPAMSGLAACPEPEAELPSAEIPGRV